MRTFNNLIILYNSILFFTFWLSPLFLFTFDNILNFPTQIGSHRRYLQLYQFILALLWHLQLTLFLHLLKLFHHFVSLLLHLLVLLDSPLILL